MRRMEQLMESLINEGMRSQRQGDTGRSSYRRPRADVFETDDAIIASIELPGANKDDIKVQRVRDGLEITVDAPEEQESDSTYRRERERTGYYRKLNLPKKANIDETEATYKNGVLELHIPTTGTTDEIEVE